MGGETDIAEREMRVNEAWEGQRKAQNFEVPLKKTKRITRIRRIIRLNQMEDKFDEPHAACMGKDLIQVTNNTI